MIGLKFARLTVISRAGTVDGKILWLCRCDCGWTVKVRSTYLRTGHTRSCGCLLGDITRSRSHPLTGSSTYTSWRKMLERCTNPASDAWKWYGGRGITVCRRWRSFANFVADMGEKPPGLTAGGRSAFTIERIDTDKNYTPSNCRWATWGEQANNRSKK